MYNGGLRCNIIGYIRKKIPLKGGMNIPQERKKEKNYRNL